MLKTRPSERPLSDHEASTLKNALRVAAERFGEHAKEMAGARDAYAAMSPEDKAAHDTGMIHGNAYRHLAGQFEQQAEDTLALLELIENGDDALTHEGAYVEIIVRTTPED